MWSRPFARMVALSGRHATVVALLLAGLSVVMAVLAATRLSVDTDTNNLIAADLPWRQQERRVDRAFPQLTDLTLVLVTGETPAAADRAAAALADRLQGRHDLFKSVQRPDALPYFRQYGLLFRSEDELRDLSQKLVDAQPLLGLLSSDPSLRGLAGALGLALDGAAGGQADIGPLVPAFRAVGNSLATLASPHPQPPAWSTLLTGTPPGAQELQRIILIRPVLDFGALEPGAKASDAIRQAARELGLTPERGVRVQLTGPVPLSDEEFASLRSGAGLTTAIALGGVLLLLLVGLRSVQLVLLELATLAAGLATTAGFAALTVGRLNLISVAFAALFVGIAVDFGIQFSVRYGAERQHLPRAAALGATGEGIGGSLALAALATSLGFFSFVPTAYTGVSELGVIAGVGMLIALLYTLTFLPALIAIFGANPRLREAGQPWAAPLDRFLVERRTVLRWLFLAVAIAAGIMAARLRFDADPLSLKDPHSESMVALGELMDQPAANPYTATILAPSLPAAEQLGARLAELPEVSPDSVMTLASFVPEDQDGKLAILGDLQLLLGPALSPVDTKAPPTPDETRHALAELAGKARAATVLPPDVRDPLAASLDRLSKGIRRRGGPRPGPPARRPSLRDRPAQDRGRGADRPGHGRGAAAGAQGRLDRALRRGPPRGGTARRRPRPHHAPALRRRGPQGGAGRDRGRGHGRRGRPHRRLRLHAALALAAVASAALLFAVLRRPRDVALVLAPLALAGVLTAAVWTAAGNALNFANIIALPLMLGIGVAFNIYFVVNWRSGHGGPLQSSLARAIVVSALTTMTAFGSLAATPHLGIRSMGELLALALGFTVLTALLVLPALLGPPPRAA